LPVCGTGSGSSAVASVVDQMIQGFAVHADGTVDEALLERLRARTELFCADAASTEQLAGQLLRTTGILPNLRFITRDRAHACQRLLSRPWAADLAVKEILDVFCMSSTSLVGRIQFSPHLQQVFQNFCEASQHNAVTGSRIKHLSWAKHRFSSISKPLGRAILHLDALLTTAVWLVVHCKDPNAVTFLETIGERELLLAAMMADAADEAVRLLRFFGEEGYELAEVAFQIRLFMSRVHVLFNEEKVYELGGYTKHCLQLLSSSRGFMLGGEARTLGGPGKVDAAKKAWCTQHLRQWVSMLGSALRAEFPHYEILAAFVVFELHADPESQDDVREYHAAAVQRLAQAFSLDAQSLNDQISDHRPIALQLKQSTGAGNLDAWRSALMKTQARKDTRARHPCDALKAVMVKYAAYQGCGTAGVEQCFSTIDRRVGPERTLTPAHRFADIKVILDADTKEKGHICSMASKLWPVFFGKPRDTSSSAPRIDKGVLRPGKRGTESAFLQKRRKAVQQGMVLRSADEVAEFADRAIGDIMETDERLKNEKQFLEAKTYKHLAHCYLEGTVLAAEVPDGLEETAVALHELSRKRDGARARQAQQHTKLMQPQAPDLRHFAHIFWMQDD
ncbi:unnamed protein product, partial [Symbiodinium pilosum]